MLSFSGAFAAVALIVCSNSADNNIVLLKIFMLLPLVDLIIGVSALTPETCERIVHNSIEEFIDGFHRGHGFIAMPLEVGPLPENIPGFPGFNISRFGD